MEINEIISEEYDYEIQLKYLGNYSNYIIEQFGNNFFDQFQVSNFSQGLMNSGILSIENFFSSWDKKYIFNIKMDKICFFLDGQEDCISFKNNEIYIFNIYSCEIKQKIIIHDKMILDIFKLTFNRICSCSKDYTIKITKISKNNTIYEVIHEIKTIQNYIFQILFFQNENIICYDSSNNFLFYELMNNKYTLIKSIEEDDEILIMKNLFDDKIMYITNSKTNDKKIKFIGLIKRIKEQMAINIKEKEQKLEVVDLLVFYDYILVCFNNRIDIINYKDKTFIKSFEYFNYTITNIIILSSNRIILGYYDSYKNESIIREHLLRIEDLQNKSYKFDCIGQGILESEKIEKIVKVNESQILTNVKDKNYIIYERINKISEKLKESLRNLNLNEVITKEVKEVHIYNNNNNINKMQEENLMVQQKKRNSAFLRSPPPIETAYHLFLRQQLKPVNIEQKYNYINNIQYNNIQPYNNSNANIISPSSNFNKNSFINEYHNSFSTENKKQKINLINNKNIKKPEKITNLSNNGKKPIGSSKNSIDDFILSLPKPNDKILFKSKNASKNISKIINTTG